MYCTNIFFLILPPTNIIILPNNFTNMKVCFLFFGRRENHRKTPAARRVDRQAVSDFYLLKTLQVSSVAQVPRLAVSRLNGSRDPGR